MNNTAVVHAYFNADNAGDIDTVIKLFHTEATVKDEGGVHEGVPSIRAWCLASKVKYRYAAELIEMTCTDDKITVRASVSGTFPNSPIMLNYLFTFDGEKIAELEIF